MLEEAFKKREQVERIVSEARENGKTPDLRMMNPRGAALWQIELAGGQLVKSDFGGVFFRGAHLSRANFNNANLTVADLIGADLRQAILRNAKVGHAKLSRAHLMKADIRGAFLRVADLCVGVVQ